MLSYIEVMEVSSPQSLISFPTDHVETDFCSAPIVSGQPQFNLFCGFQLLPYPFPRFSLYHNFKPFVAFYCIIFPRCGFKEKCKGVQKL